MSHRSRANGKEIVKQAGVNRPTKTPASNAPAQKKIRHTVEDIVRLLEKKGLPNQRGGAVVWAWVLATPILWITLFLLWLNGPVERLFTCLFALMTGRAVSKRSKDASNARAALLLPELDKDWLEALIDGLAYPSEIVQAICRLRLTTILPTLNHVAGETVSSERRALLFDYLSVWNAHVYPDLVAAILQFGAATDEEQALVGTERLAGILGITSAIRRVRDVARKCLPILEECLARQTVVSGGPKQCLSSAIPRPETPVSQLSPETQAWLDEIEAESSKRPGMRFGFLLASWSVIVPYTLYQTVAQWQVGNTFFSAFFGLGAALATQLYLLTLTPQQARIASKLASVDDVQTVGPLVEIMTWPDERIRHLAMSALTRLLPRLKSSDTQLLSAAQRAVLYETLKLSDARRHPDFLIAILACLEQVGDVEALRHVRELAGERPNTLRERRVVEAANECLPYLESCAQQNRDSQTLLRAFTNSLPEANLLRPAGRQIDADPELLLRTATPSDPA